MTLVSLDRETVRGFGKTPGLMTRMKSLVARTRAIRQLHQLDDRLLADIGVNRGEINARVWGH